MEHTKSAYIVVKKSNIHNKGVFAKIDIPKNSKIIEYVGEKISKAEAEKRSKIILENSKLKKEAGAVYIFHLNKRQDIDGNVWYNTAKYINHSCHPNCEAVNFHGHIWIVSLRIIKKGEELSYNYGYDFENYKDHVCKCGSHNCIGFILDKKHWKKLKK